MKKRIYSIDKRTAFTLAEGAAHAETLNNCRKTAFTLAEVLITIGVLGVVAAITLPNLISDINTRVNTERQVNIAQKITQAMEQMRAHGKLNTFANTEAFVDELQKYLKVNKRCDADHIAECWPTETVINSNNQTYSVANAKTRNMIVSGSNGNTDGNVGLVLSDGAAIILTYNKDAAGLDVGSKIKGIPAELPISKHKNKNFSYTTSVTNSIDFIMDVNGKRGPNAEELGGVAHDIRSFRDARFAVQLSCFETSSGDKVCKAVADAIDCTSGSNGACNPNTNKDYPDGCDSKYLHYCSGNTSYTDDYWAGAKKACDDAGMRLPTYSELQTIDNNKNNYIGSNNRTLASFFNSGSGIITSDLLNPDVYVGYPDGCDDGNCYRDTDDNGGMILCK